VMKGRVTVTPTQMAEKAGARASDA
jgi:hypothetical protein